MSGRGQFHLALVIQRSSGPAVPIEQPDSEVFVETQSAGQFFLEGLGNRLGHGGIKRWSASARPFRAARFANAPLHPKSPAPLPSCSFSEARGRVHREKSASQYSFSDRTPRLPPSR